MHCFFFASSSSFSLSIDVRSISVYVRIVDRILIFFSAIVILRHINIEDNNWWHTICVLTLAIEIVNFRYKWLGLFEIVRKELSYYTFTVIRSEYGMDYVARPFYYQWFYYIGPLFDHASNIHIIKKKQQRWSEFIFLFDRSIKLRRIPIFLFY